MLQHPLLPYVAASTSDGSPAHHTNCYQLFLMPVVAIGIDIVRISRISHLLAKSKSRFLNRVLHPSELDICSRLPDTRKAQYVAGSWAAKEALFKTLDIAAQKEFQFRKWYRFAQEKRPFIGRENWDKNEEFHLSISHDGDILVATVLRQKLE